MTLKFNGKNFKKGDFSKMVLAAIRKATNRDNMKRYSKIAYNDLVRNSRVGRITREDGKKPVKLPSLKTEYIEQREYAKKRNELSNATSPRRSNLTFSGDLLNKGFIASSVNGAFTIHPKDAYRGQVEGLATRKYDRDFLHFSKATLSKINKEINRIINTELR